MIVKRLGSLGEHKFSILAHGRKKSECLYVYRCICTINICCYRDGCELSGTQTTEIDAKAENVHVAYTTRRKNTVAESLEVP
jgi:hypothetical protein